MRAVLTRVSRASVAIDGEIVGQIDRGFLILLGVGPNDTEKECRLLAEKALGLRIFEDEKGKMNKSVIDVGGEVLLISQFTLLADTSKGNRPGFDMAEERTRANFLYECAAKQLEALGITVKKGVFGADMQIIQHNDGPVTIVYSL